MSTIFQCLQPPPTQPFFSKIAQRDKIIFGRFSFFFNPIDKFEDFKLLKMRRRLQRAKPIKYNFNYDT